MIIVRNHQIRTLQTTEKYVSTVNLICLGSTYSFFHMRGPLSWFSSWHRPCVTHVHRNTGVRQVGHRSPLHSHGVYIPVVVLCICIER